ncbi:hypothetical protein FEM48_ZijujUnG0122000 [Ziziphus jujuba var. spinosa]|uniref:Regulator of rDNA transcription protein 15 n=1 Tax=Ziziphus jujuba var. spinosa TaxID=714518 RepID=A0A978U7U0_ZIZJJ|nr:hypothetical protein FEM48_ZijujUnG0122000 [Ziziphus jujuba var. spinosa]
MGMAWGTVGMVWGIGGHGMGHRWASHGASVGIAWGTVGIAWGIGGHRMGHRWASCASHGARWASHGARWASHGASMGIAWGIGGNRGLQIRRSKGSIGHAFTGRIRTGNQNQTSFYPFVPHEISVLVELILGHLRYILTDVPPQPKLPTDNVFHPDRPPRQALGPKRGAVPRFRFME